MAMLVGKSWQFMQGKGRVGRTGPGKDQIGMPCLVSAARLQAGPAGEIPLLALPMAARHCHPAGMGAHLIILMESPALVRTVYQG